MRRFQLAFCLTLAAVLSSPAEAQIQAGDLVFGLQTPCTDVNMNMIDCEASEGEFTDTLELVRGLQGTPMAVTPNPWDMSTTPFIQSVEFDNLNGVSHNGAGNMLGLSFGPNDLSIGGTVYNFGTDGSNPNGQLIGQPATGLGGSNVLATRLASLSISPDNTKIAVNGYSSGTVIIYDYTAGDVMGGGASLSNARESAVATLTLDDTSGTAWIDNNTALGFSPDGTLFEIDAATANATFATSLSIAGGNASLSALEYNSAISPFVFGVVSGFSGTTVNELVVLDPTNSYSVVNQFDFSTAAPTAREIAFDAAGNLYIGGFGSDVSVINGAAANAATITAADISLIYEGDIFSSFNGFDIAHAGGGPDVDGDFDDDGDYDCDDVDALVADIAAGNNTASFDLTADGSVDVADRDAWLAEAGAANLGVSTFLIGDANLDGTVDGLDFIEWNNNKFTSLPSWCGGDFNVDGTVDGLDFIEWNNNKFTSASDAVVPEPAGVSLMQLGLVAMLRRRS